MSVSASRAGTIARNVSSLTTAVVRVGNDAPSQWFHVWNSGTGTLEYALSDDVEWLSVEPASGSSTGEHDVVQVNYAVSTLPVGSYTGWVTISSADASNSPQKVKAPVVILPPPPPPGIAREPSVVYGSAYAGGNSAGSYFHVWNAGTGTLNYALASDSTWFSVTPPSGSSTGEHDTAQISYAVAGLPVGSYTGWVTITSADATNSPQAIRVIVGVLRPLAGPAIAREPSLFTRGVHTGGNLSSNFVFWVWNAGTGAMSYALSSSAGWLTPVPTSGSSTGEHDAVQLNYDMTGLAAGTYTGVVTISSSEATNSPQTAKAIVTVLPPRPGPTLARDGYSSYCRTVCVGGTLSSNSFTVWNSGTGTLNYALSSDAAWLAPVPTSGSSTGEHDRIQINYDVAALPVGAYTGTVTISSAEATNSPLFVRVTLCVVPPKPGPTIARDPSYVGQSVLQGRNPCTNCFQVWNSGTGTLNYAVSDDAAWFSVTPSSGSSTGEHDMVLIGYDASSLPVGMCTGTVTISSADATNSPQTVRVTLCVVQPPPGPTIARDAYSYSRSVYAGGTLSSNVFTVWNSGTGTLNYALSSDAAWLTPIPTTGVSSGEHDRIQINYSVSTLPVGTYTGTVSITSADAANSPQKVQVTLCVLWTRPGPTLAREPASFSRSQCEGASLSSNVFYVWNAGTGTLAYALSSDAAWLTPSPSAGVSTGEHDRIQIGYATASLAAGTYTGRVTIAAQGAANAPLVVTVVLLVTPAPPGPAIAFFPPALYRSVVAAKNGGSQTFELWNAGTGTLWFALSDDVPWLSVYPTNGAVGSWHSAVQVRYATEAMPLGVYTGLITIASANATNSPQTLRVTLTVTRGREVRIGSTAALPGDTVSLPVIFSAQGDETALGFSLDFDPSLLAYRDASPGSDSNGLSVILSTNSASLGRVGVYAMLPPGERFAPGARELLVARFDVDPDPATPSTFVGFGDLPVVHQILDTNGVELLAYWVGGNVTLSSTRNWEGDAHPRQDGDGHLTLADWYQVRRFAMGLETPASGSEFQRVDCAPRTDTAGGVIGGDGKITLADWAQVGRYLSGLDPLTPACGPTAPTGGGSPAAGGKSALAEVSLAGDDAPALQAESITVVRGQTRRMRITLVAKGTETAAAFSLAYDPSLLTFDRAELGAGAQGATLLTNDASAAAGRVGFSVGLPTGWSFAAGPDRILDVYFAAAPAGSDATTTVSLGDDPVAREVVSADAQPLTPACQDATVALKADSDGDGVADSWEIEHLGDINSVDLNADPDEDGLSNYQEYIAGTDPNVPDEVLRVSLIALTEQALTQVEWQSAAGRTYTLLRMNDLFGGGLTVLDSGIDATPPANVYYDGSAGSSAFYRVIVEQQ
jgi:hypothetical protein